MKNVGKKKTRVEEDVAEFFPPTIRRDTIPEGRVRCPRERWAMFGDLLCHSSESHGRNR